MNNINPYNYNMPARPSMFYGRQKQLTLLFKDLSTIPGDSCALVGGRRIGKTSLLENIITKINQSNEKSSTYLVPIYINLANGEINSPYSFFNTVIKNLYVSIKKNININSEQPLVSTFESKLLDWNKEVLSKIGTQGRLLILLDECEHVANNKWANDLYSMLRSILTSLYTRDLIKVVMAGGYQFLSKVQETGSPLRNILKYYMLEPLDVLSAKQLIMSPNPNPPPSLVIQEIINQSGCHPFLIQYLMHYLYELKIENSGINNVRDIANLFLKERNDFYDWLEAIGSEANSIYKALINFSVPLSSKELRAGFMHNPQGFKRSLEALCYHGLVLQDHDTYQINGVLFKNWFISNYVELGEKEITVIFNSIKSKINLLPPNSNKDSAYKILNDLELEIRQGEKVNVKKTKALLDFLSGTLPDIWDVAINSLSNPIHGVSTVVKKIAERAKQEKNNSKIK